MDNQRNEMRDFVNSMGYSDIIYVEGIGASAIKINDEYIEMYAEVRKHIENGDISAVAVWAVNRLARDEEWFIRFKKLFIENKIQFIVKNPTLSLLNEDGSVNAGSELALSLFSTMAKQDMEEKKAKFMLQRLYEYYVRHPDALPEDFHPQLSFDGMERTVCDYIAGMTDNYAVDKYTEIFIPMGWNVRG